jgi:hyperosmotically inducible periplasmic protein
MKAMSGIRAALGVVLATALIGAWAQGGASAATAGTALTASGGMTAKASRQANRLLPRKVYAALVKHKEIDAGDIGNAAKDGAVLITGTVQDASQINTVTEVAKGVAGVTSVTSKLTVRRPFDQ